MPVPKFRTSRSKRDMRRSHHAIKTRNGATCPNCGEIKLAHTVCSACGHYKGKQVIASTKQDHNFEESFETDSAHS